MTQKAAIITAAVLLVAGVGTAVYTATHSKDAPSSGGTANSKSQMAAGESTGMDSPAPARSKFHERQTAKDKPDLDGELVSTYGESRVKLAKRITSSIIGLLGPDGIGGFAAVMAGQTGKKSLDDLGKKLALNDSQQQQAREAYQKSQARRNQQLTSNVERLNSNAKTFSEVLLAGDAYKRNKISKQEYDAIAAKFDLGAADMSPMSPEKLMADAEFVNALKSCLGPAQLQLLEKEALNPPAQPIVVNSSGAEALANAEALGSRQGPPAQVIALNMNMDFARPETLENLDSKVTSMVNTIQGLNAILEGSKGTQDATSDAP